MPFVTLTTPQAVAGVAALLSLMAVPMIEGAHATPDPVREPLVIGVAAVPLAIGSALAGCLAKNLWKIQHKGEKPTFREDVLGFLSAAVVAVLAIPLAHDWLIPWLGLPQSDGSIMAICGTIGIYADNLIPLIDSVIKWIYKSRTGEELPK